MIIKKKSTVLVILDGFGYSKKKKYNAIFHARMPHLDAWLKKYPHTLLQASGTAVGLPKGYIGNSEVGHMTIGAGRIITQDITRVLKAIDDGSFFTNKTLVSLLKKLAHKKNKALHIMGLLSDGGVHAHQKIAYALITLAKQMGIKKVYIHAFLDGRDVAPQSAAIYLKKLDTVCKKLKIGTLGSITGRFYAMDRDKHWKRTQQAYDCLTEKQPTTFSSWQDALNYYYKKDITDEFIPPTQLDNTSIIKPGDGVIFFNIRPDRARQLTEAFTEKKFNHFPVKKLNLTWFATMTDYDKNLKATVIFKPLSIKNTLKDILEKHHKTMFSIAETEKYAHVTYFFNGGSEKKLKDEKRVLIPSIPARNYVNHPCMSAPQITKAVLISLKKDPCDFYLINYANADMVGHSGNFKATVKAVECLDYQLAQLYHEVVEKCGGTLYITADHGNAEEMFDEKTGQPKTAHTNNPVIFLMIEKGVKKKKLSLKKLSDIAPFILKHMGII
ncbi:MAG: 2,3-bisphosphoglycerate-independent phosphoglycerate mutase [Candidatus Babeliales bacterium]